MPTVTAKLPDLFSDAVTPLEQVTRFEAFKGELNKSAQITKARTQAGQRFINGEWVHPGSPVESQLADIIATPDIEKALSPELLASIRGEMARSNGLEADLGKELSLTYPIGTGMVAYDLEAPAKMLFPRQTPLRNKVGRVKGIGKSRQFKRITGISGTGTGGLARVSPFISDTSTVTVGGVNLRRGNSIAYAGDERNIGYRQMGLSDDVTWSAEFAGQGFQDQRQLSQTAVLYASMLADEYAILGGRGTDSTSGCVGVVTAPAGITATARAAAGSEVGLTAAGKYWIKVTAITIFGESLASTVVGLDSVTAGQVIDVTVGTEHPGALGYNVYIAQVAAAGADPGDAARFFQGSTGYRTFTAQGTMALAGPVPTGVDTSANANSFDGYLAVLLDPTQSGYVGRINKAFSTLNPGAEYQDAFGSLWASVKADPDEILISGQDRRQLSNAIQGSSGNVPNYRMTISQDETSGVTIGVVTKAIENEITGKTVPLTVHPWMPQGNSLVLSHELPIADSGVASTVQYVLPQDYMAVDWPVIQHTYDTGSYWFGAPVFYAPAWSGAVVGIKGT